MAGERTAHFIENVGSHCSGRAEMMKALSGGGDGDDEALDRSLKQFFTFIPFIPFL